MRWKGKNIRPYGPIITKKQEFNYEQSLKPLGEKLHEMPVWQPVLANVYKEPETGPQPTPSITPSNTPTPSVTAQPTSTPTNTPTNTNTPTPSVTPPPTGTPTNTPTPTATPSVFLPSNISNLQLWYDATSGATTTSWTNLGLLGGNLAPGGSTSGGGAIEIITGDTLGSYVGPSVRVTINRTFEQTFTSTSFSAHTTYVVFKNIQSTQQTGFYVGSNWDIQFYKPATDFVWNTEGGTSRYRTSALRASQLNNTPILYNASGTTTMSAEFNGAVEGTLTTITAKPTTATNFRIGVSLAPTSQTADIRTFEFIRYNKVLSIAEHNQVMAYLEDKYDYSTW